MPIIKIMSKITSIAWLVFFLEMDPTRHPPPEVLRTGAREPGGCALDRPRMGGPGTRGGRRAARGPSSGDVMAELRAVARQV
jgi:hypothetical protein